MAELLKRMNDEWYGGPNQDGMFANRPYVFRHAGGTILYWILLDRRTFRCCLRVENSKGEVEVFHKRERPPVFHDIEYIPKYLPDVVDEALFHGPPSLLERKVPV